MTTVTYYFDNYDAGVNEWGHNPANMVDGDINTDAHENIGDTTELLTTNECVGADLGTIGTVELRAYGHLSSLPTSAAFVPYFGGANDGDNHASVVPLNEGWGSYKDITSDTNAPSPWTWADIQNLDCKVNAILAGGTPYVAKVEVRVTYSAGGGSASLLLCV